MVRKGKRILSRTDLQALLEGIDMQIIRQRKRSKDYLNDSVRDRFAPGRLDCTVPASRTIELERENARFRRARIECGLVQLQAEFQVLKQQLDWFRRQLFGEKSEKRLDLDPVEQGNLLTGLGVETPPGLDEPSTHRHL